MPWHVVQEHSECPAGKPWAVVKDDTGEIEGCHSGETDANAQMAALYASEERQANYTCECLECGHMMESDEHCADIACPECGGEMRREERPGEGRQMKDSEIGTIRGLWDKFVNAVEDALFGKDRAWDGSASRYDSTEQYCSACLIDVNSAAGRDEKAQSHCKLPTKNPGSGAHDFEGIQAAAGVLAGARGGVKKPDDVPQDAWDKAVKSAANTIISQYSANDQVAPDGVYEAAGKSPPEERAISGLRLYEQVWAELDRTYPDEWPWLTDFYVDDDGQMFAVFASDGKLHRVNFTIQGEQIMLGERTQVTETFTPVSTTRVFRQADGRHRWLSISATAVLNRCAEIDARDLFDGFVAHATETGKYPYRCFCHRGEQFRTGQADFLARDGNCYITSGLYDDTELARREIAALEKDSAYWGESIGYEPLAGPELVEINGIEIPVYRTGIHTEISTLPEGMAAAWFTSTSIISEAQMERQMGDIEYGVFVNKLFDGDETEAKRWLEENVDPANRQIEEREMITRDQEPVEPPTEPETPVEPVQPVIELDDTAVDAITTRMAESEIVTTLIERVAELMTMVESLAKTTEGLQRSVTAGLKTAGEHGKRLEQLERDEAEKQDGWIKDLSARATMPHIRVTHRPSVAHSRRQADGGQDYSATAEATLAGMNTKTS